MRWFSNYALAAGIALIIATNAVVLIGVQYNRSGEPDAVVNLTEREMTLPYSYGFARENSGLSLRLTWRVADKGQDSDQLNYFRNSPAWMDKSKLAALGFAVTDDPDTPEGKRRYGKLLPRDVLLVLEYDGETYQRKLNMARQHLQEEEILLAGNPGNPEFIKRVKEAQNALLREEQASSRLFVIDAGTDTADLRAQYADRSRYMIAPGQVRLTVGRSPGQKPRLSGMIDSLEIQEVNVPLEYRHVLDPFLADNSGLRTDRPPRYTVKLIVGRRLEPWIKEVSTL